MYLIGIEVGATASKALAIDKQGVVIASQSYPHYPVATDGLWPEQDPENWWEAASSALRDIMQIVPPTEVLAIGLSGQMYNMAVLDVHGEPIRPALLWDDRRSEEQCEAITRHIGGRVLYPTIGSTVTPALFAPKILWLREHEPRTFADIRQILLPKDYVRYKLSGTFATDTSDACSFGLFDVGRRTWAYGIIHALDIPLHWLPELHEAPQVCAYVSETAAGLTGLKAGTPIIAGASSEPAAAIAAGIVAVGQASLSVGDSGVAFAVNNEYHPEPFGRLQTFCHAVPELWFHMSVMLSGAGGLHWLREALAPNTTLEELTARADAVPRGALGLLFAPYLTGGRHPHPDPLARGAFVGLTLRHTLPHMVRAVMEGIAFGMRENLELLRSQGVHPQEAAICCDAARSKVWRQIMADIMGIPLYTVNTTEGSALGAAILAGVGAQIWPDVETASRGVVHQTTLSTPDPESVAEYDRLYPAFREVYPSLKGTYAMLAGFGE